MSGYVVVNASLAVRWVATEEGSSQALTWLSYWELHGMQMVAPRLLIYEAANALWRKALNLEIPEQEAVALMDDVESLDIEYRDLPGASGRAIVLALEMGHDASYDLQYLVLAQELGCEVWTCDRPFASHARARGHAVRLVR